MKGLATAILMAAAFPAMSEDITRVEATGSVGEVMDRLQGAVSGAGATVFARVDHGAGAQGVGMPIGASELLIFGNPALGTPAMIDDPMAGLFLPLKVLAYEDADGKVWLAYQDPGGMFGDLNINPDAGYVGKMRAALGTLTAVAAGG